MEWRRKRRPRKVFHTVGVDVRDNRPNAATSGVPSEIGAEDAITPKCRSVSISKLQSPMGFLATRRADEAVKPIRLGEFDGCSVPTPFFLYLNGIAHVDHFGVCSASFPNRVQASNFYARVSMRLVPNRSSDQNEKQNVWPARNISCQLWGFRRNTQSWI